MSEFVSNDRFDVVRRLGTGGCGVVYEVVDRQRKSRVALKTLSRLDAAALYRFKREFRALADVAHPNLVQLYELFAEQRGWFFTMELVPGRDFLGWVTNRSTFERRQSARGSVEPLLAYDAESGKSISVPAASFS